ncbi:uncharacterized protein C6orf136 homolog isoform X1 [Takifugu flavidus]|uniref:uncharacterized protein C6orf136 homolog isoform X1 n=1 Tax=Takifugu flavidus TaxID=433684 RepID=UPI00254456CD|nr:uncharacterized protein C6orf136 homolog isoform X1 [Takifugu flavidus]
MAVSRWGFTFRVTSVCCPARRQSVKTKSWILSQAFNWQLIYETRAMVCASWAVAPPNSLRYHNTKQLPLSHPLHPAVRPHCEGTGHWEDSISLCELVPQGEVDSLQTVLEIPVCWDGKLGDLLGVPVSSEFCFPLTTVDGRRPDDISVGAIKRQHSCFRSLFEGESCPAPFTSGSHFYCFHCLGREPALSRRTGTQTGAENKHLAVPQQSRAALCSHTETVQSDLEEDGKREEKLALMYERLRTELPRFFQKNHDYSMYSADLEFINGPLNMKTRGRVRYQLFLSLWRLLSLCYYAEVRLEVLKLTKHMEDGTIKARWRVKGLPFHSVLLRFYYKDKSQLYRTSDAFSTFYLGEDGLIHCHRVEKVLGVFQMMPSQPPILSGVTSLLAKTLVALGLQEQRPALNLLPLLLTSLRQARTSQQD